MEEKGIEVTPVTFTTILHGLYKKGRSEEAESFWDEKVTKKGCVPNVGVYNVLLMHIHGGEIKGIKSLIDKMSNAGIKPDVVSYYYLMTSYCKNGMMDEVKKVYDELGSKCCNANTTTFRTFLFYLCKQGRYATGYKAWGKLVEDLGLAPTDTNEVDSSELEMAST
ncbi:pentatricopeptide repeat-containing protein At4g36680, mitochondrial-like [Olea europaea var. sylvestris]|uniref:pentatricopeptide repeat-containing protein At4g36680, mitochondrial-like n=1 Tax=Olea europaea var. sylvestris TaxID=158386 RepID=UPI000C1D10A9|nr:pentatricopeptide repeat-containing protein At4g36680, mitochondrial-like [Olea europaea var. sylvestris]